MDDLGDADAGLVEHFVRSLKALLHRCVGRAFLLELLVEDDNHRVDLGLQVFNPLLGRAHAAGAFKAEGLRHDGNGENSHFLRDLGDHGRSARARAAAHAGGDEEEVGPADRLGHLLALFLRGGGADFRTGARAEPGAAELNIDVRLRALQGLMIRVGRNELNALGAVRNHVLDGISAAAAHADHLDDGFQGIKFRENFESHFNL